MVATTLAICAVFVPIAFMGGVVGRFFREFGLVATFAVLISMLVALTLTPMLCSRYLRAAARPTGVVYRRARVRLRGAREPLPPRPRLGAARTALPVVVLALAAVRGRHARSPGASRSTSSTAEDRSEFNVWLKMPLGSTVEQTQAQSRAVEAELRRASGGARRVRDHRRRRQEARQRGAALRAAGRPRTSAGASQVALMAELRRRIAALGLPLAGLRRRGGAADQRSRERAPRRSCTPSAVPTSTACSCYATQLDGAHAQTPAATPTCYLSYETGKPEIALEIARERAADLGVPALQIGRTIAAMVAGFEATTFEESGERYDVRVQVRPEYRDDPSKLDLLRVRAPSGALVPLRNLVTPRIGSGPVQIDRENRTRAITLYGNLEGKAAGTADEEVMRFGARARASAASTSSSRSGPSQRLRETTAAVGFAFVLALVAIYMILASQFNSFVHPFTIMLSAPLSFIGAFAADLAARLLARPDGADRLPDADGHRDEERHPAGRLHQHPARARASAVRGRSRGRPDAHATGADDRGVDHLRHAAGRPRHAATARSGAPRWASSRSAASPRRRFLTLLVVPVVYTLVDEAGAKLNAALLRLRGASAIARSANG